MSGICSLAMMYPQPETEYKLNLLDTLIRKVQKHGMENNRAGLSVLRHNGKVCSQSLSNHLWRDVGYKPQPTLGVEGLYDIRPGGSRGS
jgi:hypothetical protein